VSGSAGGRYRRRLVSAFGLVCTLFVVELVAGVLSGSLALLSDAGHLFTDVVGIGMAIAAIETARRAAARTRHSYGLYRLEILAALANSVLLLGVAVTVLVEAFRRMLAPPEVDAATMLAVGAVGLLVNLVAYALLHEGSKHSLNVHGAALEVFADALSSLGVIGAATVLIVTGWPYADPLFAAAIAVLIVPRAWKLGREAVRVLVQAAPANVDPAAVTADLAALDGVCGVHDVHLWTLTSGMDVATAHLVVLEGADQHGVLDRARDLLEGRYGIPHATLQVEPTSHKGCDTITW
jgi:cobalt-zinc-cadmium efflux system protein